MLNVTFVLKDKLKVNNCQINVELQFFDQRKRNGFVFQTHFKYN